MRPPGLSATTELCGEHITADGTTDLTTRNGQLRYLMCRVCGLGVSRPEAHRLVVAYERDRRNPLPRSVSITRAELDELRAEDFRRWANRRHGRLSACDQRVGGPNWRTHS